MAWIKAVTVRMAEGQFEDMYDRIFSEYVQGKQTPEALFDLVINNLEVEGIEIVAGQGKEIHVEAYLREEQDAI